MADDSGGGFGMTVLSGGAGVGDGLDVFNLAHGLHLIRAIGAVLATDLDEHGGTHVVAAVHICCEIWQKILLVVNGLGTLDPKMVVGVADRNLRLQRSFSRQSQPFIACGGHVDPPCLSRLHL